MDSSWKWRDRNAVHPNHTLRDNMCLAIEKEKEEEEEEEVIDQFSESNVLFLTGREKQHSNRKVHCFQGLFASKLIDYSKIFTIDNWDFAKFFEEKKTDFDV